MRVLVCGDRNWQDQDMIYQVLDQLPQGTTIVHGAARGADRMAGNIADDIDSLSAEPYPADWNKHEDCYCPPDAAYCKVAGLRRNQQMLDSGIDRVLAFHDDLAHSKGTKDMVARAEKAGVRVALFRH